jgi:uncharacterized protein involved in outer membrane biogenesis
MKTIKRVCRIMLLIAAAFAVLLVACALLLHTPPVKNWIRAQAEKYVREKYSAELKIDRLRFSIVKGFVSVEGLTLRSAVEPDLEPLLRIKRADIGLNLIPTIWGSTSIEFVRLEDADIYVVADKAGRLNMPNFGGGNGGGKLQIRTLEITNGSLQIEDRRQQIGLRLPSFGVQAQGQGADLLGRVALKTNKHGMVKYQEYQFEINNLEIDAEMIASTLKIRSLNLDAVGAKAIGSGSIHDLSNPEFDLKIDAEINLEQAAAVFGWKQGLKGRASGNITIAGPLGNLQIGGNLHGNIASAIKPPQNSGARNHLGIGLDGAFKD